MATQKIGLTKLGLKKNTNLIPLEWGDQVIQIREYLPIEDKIGVIERIVNQSLDNNNFANPARIMINTVLEVIFAYTTNINFVQQFLKKRQIRICILSFINHSLSLQQYRQQLIIQKKTLK